MSEQANNSTAKQHVAPPLVPAIEVVNVDSLISGLDDENTDVSSVFDNLSLSEDEDGNCNNSRRGMLSSPLRPTAEPPASGGAYLPREYSMHRNNAMATAVAAVNSSQNDDVSVAATEVTCSTTDGSIVMIPRAALVKDTPPTNGASVRYTNNSKISSSSSPLYARNVIDLEKQTPTTRGREQSESEIVQNLPTGHGNQYVSYTSNGGVFLSKRCVKLLVICLVLLVTVFVTTIGVLALMEASDKGPFENDRGSNSNAAVVSPGASAIESGTDANGYNARDDSNNNRSDEGGESNASTNLDLFNEDGVPDESSTVPPTPCPNGGRALGHGWGGSGGGGGGGGGGSYNSGSGCNGG